MPGPFYFAWAGGAIEDQVTVVTTGSTHGASFDTVAIVGNIVSGGRQLTSLATNQGLETGVYYALSGPGIPANTHFVFDDSVLSGLKDSINLSSTATATNKSTTFTATRSVSVGVALGTLVSGSSSVTLTDTGGLPAGTYGVFGTGIGETDVPVGTQTGTTITTGGGILTIGSCYLVYDGSGGGSLKILTATPHITTGLDEFSQTTTITTYSIAEQSVRATASGIFPMQLSGFPTGDAAQITNLPSTAFTTLTPGLRYNISGNGIPIGAIFTAPSSGTSIEIDVDATASDTNAILTITGPRTPNAAFDASIHSRFDEDIVNLEIAQEEGGFATLTVELRNPNIGLLATGRNLWCWLSWDQNWGLGVPLTIPLFNGRLIGVPKLQAGEIVELQFLARPDDLNAQKSILAESLQVSPYYDPIWISTNATTDTVLETYSALYHTDRVDLSCTISDIIDGEAGTISINEGQALYDKFSLAYGQPPLSAIEVSGTVSWQQQAEGTLDVTQRIVDAFSAAGSAYKTTARVDSFNNGGGGLIQCLCGDGLQSDWPRPGTSIGGGWSLSSATDGSGYPLCYILDAVVNSKGGWLTPTTVDISYSGTAPLDDQTGKTADESNVDIFLQPFGQYTVSFPLNVYKIRMNLDYRANRRRTETVTAVVTAGVQHELSDSAENDREVMTMTSDYVGQGVDPEGVPPIGNIAHRSYFQTDRGASSVEYLLLAARAKIRARARAVDVTFGVAWQTALPITLRHNVEYTDRRLPGGVVMGKVKSYKLNAGTSGMWGEFTIGCAIGTGDATTAASGVNSYVENGYVNIGYQVVSGVQTMLATDDLSYQTLDDFVITDDGLDLENVTVKTAVNLCVVHNGLKTQLPAVSAFHGLVAPSFGSPLGTMRTLTTTVTLDLKPVQGAEFHTDFFPAVSQLAIPKTIDLSASSGH